jgi:predicted glycosyltransferase involved in capsule biosynthesis
MSLKYKTISFGTSCMGRRHHIEKTYLKNIETALKVHDKCEFILLNWNSQDGLDDWVQKNLTAYREKGIVKYLRTQKPQEFHQSRTKNITGKNATGHVVCHLDADNILVSKYIESILSEFKNDENKLLKCNGGPLGGRMSCLRKSFVRLRGYDEAMTGWGHEDNDFVERFRTFFSAKLTTLGEPDSMFSDPCCGKALQHPRPQAITARKKRDNGSEIDNATANRETGKQNRDKKSYIVNPNSWGELPK